MFLPYINMNWPQVYMCPLHPEPPSYLLPDVMDFLFVCLSWCAPLGQRSNRGNSWFAQKVSQGSYICSSKWILCFMEISTMQLLNTNFPVLWSFKIWKDLKCFKPNFPEMSQFENQFAPATIHNKGKTWLWVYLCLISSLQSKIPGPASTGFG